MPISPSTSSTSSSSFSTVPVLDAKTHKHYHAHIDTPYPVLEHAASDSSALLQTSFFDTKKQSHHLLHKYTSHIPNPAHMIEDHIAEFRYGQMSRAAKREARQASQHSGYQWSLDLEQLRSMAIPESEEAAEEWSERDREAWAAELEKREKARRSLGSEPSWTLESDAQSEVKR